LADVGEVQLDGTNFIARGNLPQAQLRLPGSFLLAALAAFPASFAAELIEISSLDAKDGGSVRRNGGRGDSVAVLLILSQKGAANLSGRCIPDVALGIAAADPHVLGDEEILAVAREAMAGAAIIAGETATASLGNLELAQHLAAGDVDDGTITLFRAG